MNRNKLVPTGPAQQVAWRNFSAKQIRTLRKMGIEVIGSSLGDVYDMTPKSIHLAVNGEIGCTRPATEVRDIADGKAHLVLDITLLDEEVAA